MEEKQSTTKPKPAKKSSPPETTAWLEGIDWPAVGAEVEKMLREKGYTKQGYIRNPRYLQGVMMKVVAKAIVARLPEKGGN